MRGYLSSTSSDSRRNHSSGPRSSTSQLFHDARLHVRLGQYKQAIQDYDEAIILNLLHVNSYVAGGRAHQLLGNSTEAERDLQKVTELGYTPKAILWKNHDKPLHRRRPGPGSSPGILFLVGIIICVESGQAVIDKMSSPPPIDYESPGRSGDPTSLTSST